MNNGIKEHWQRQALIQEKDEIDALRKVLDPADVKGVKNSYIDSYLKYYLRESLRPEEDDILLEIGCGIGRLTEYMARLVHAVYGTDIIEKFIDECRANVNKRENSFYLKSGELDRLKPIMINKMYIVWVLMYIQKKSEVIEMLVEYRKSLPYLKTAVVLEQVKSCPQTVYREGSIDCCYRTTEEYAEIFRASGFNLKGYAVMGERYNGFLYRLIHVLGNFLPKQLAKKSEAIFHFDRKMMSDNAARDRLINNKIPTDIAFSLEVA